MADKDVEVKIKLKDEVSNNLKKVSNNVISSTGRITDETKRMTSAMSTNNKHLIKEFFGLSLRIGVAISVYRKFTQFRKDTIELAKTQIDAEAELTATLGYESEALKQYASELQKASVYGDELILSSMSLITAFIKEESAVKRIQKAALDLASAKHMDLRTATDLLVKSISSGTNALSRYGIQMDTAGNQTQRMDSLLGNVESAFGGMAEAMSRTDSGRIKQIENAVGDLKEKIGFELLPATREWNELILKIAEKTTPIVIEKLRGLSAVIEHITGKTPLAVSEFKHQIEIWKESAVGSDIMKNKLKELESQYSNFRVELSKLSRFSGKRGPLNQEITITKGKIDAIKEALKGLSAESKNAGVVNAPSKAPIDTKAIEKEKAELNKWLSDIGPSREDFDKQIQSNTDALKRHYSETTIAAREAANQVAQADDIEYQSKLDMLSKIEDAYAGNFDAIAEIRSTQNALMIQQGKKLADQERNELLARAQNYQSFGQSIGQAIGSAFTGQEDSIKQGFKNILAVTLGFLEKQMLASIVGNQLKNFMTLGPGGLLKAAGETAMITGIFSAAKAGIQAFSNGGIVAGNSYSGDSVIARVNSDEMILNRQDQAHLFNVIKGNASTTTNNNGHSIVVNLQDSNGNLIDTITSKIGNNERGTQRLVDELIKRIS